MEEMSTSVSKSASNKSKTLEEFESIKNRLKELFNSKLDAYGLSWAHYRPEAIYDQVYIKVKRNKVLESSGDPQVEESIQDNLDSIINYSIIALILNLGTCKLDVEGAKTVYLLQFLHIIKLMNSKNHDYGEAWREMYVKSFTDICLAKLLRIKNTIDSGTFDKKIIEDAYTDIVNYSMFYLIRLEEDAL